MNDQQRLAFFSANLYQYIPGLPWSGHPALFRQYQQLHVARPIPATAKGRVEGLDPECRAGIMAAFHLGDHTLLPASLASSGIPLDILIDRDTYEQYATVLQAGSNCFADGETGPIRFHFSEDPRLFYRVREGLRQGRFQLFFVDGNGGSQPSGLEQQQDNLVAVPFFSGKLHVKRGVAVLARLLKVPIYPVIGTGDRDHPVYGVQEPVCSDPALDREADARRILEHLYRLLEEHIRPEPMLWECWSYLHLNGMLQPPCEVGNVAVPENLGAGYMAGLHENGRSYWLDKRTYVMYCKK